MSAELTAGQAVDVTVPATSANLGPGFDCAGLALDWRERVSIVVLEHGYAVDVSGEGADRIPRDESHLIIQSVLLGLADLGVRAPGIAVRGHNTIPHGRGLGSSSAAIVAGLVAARALVGLPEDRDWVLRHAYAMEGHPDNVAAAVHGGFTLAYEGGEGLRVATPTPVSEVSCLLYVAGHELETRRARGLLPDRVPHVDAALNSGRAALLVHAMTTAPDLLLDATRDWLHTTYRRVALPASHELITDLRARGHAAVISGAGPSVLVLGRRGELASLAATPVIGFSPRQLEIGTGAAPAWPPPATGFGST